MKVAIIDWETKWQAGCMISVKQLLVLHFGIEDLNTEFENWNTGVPRAFCKCEIIKAESFFYHHSPQLKFKKL